MESWSPNIYNRGQQVRRRVIQRQNRALILCFPTLEAKNFLVKHVSLKNMGIFLGDDITLSHICMGVHARQKYIT